MSNKFDIYKKKYKTSLETPNIAYHLIDKHCNSYMKDNIALSWISKDNEKESYSFSDLNKLSNKFANMMISMGVKKGDVVVLFIDNLPELYIGFLGSIKTGAVITYISSNIGTHDLKKRLILLKAKIILTTPELRNKLNEIIFELFELQHIVVVNRNNFNDGLLDIADLDYYQEIDKNSSDFDIKETLEEDISIIYYPSIHPISISHGNLLNYYLVSNYVIENTTDEIYFSNVSTEDVNFINFNICYPWINGSNNVVFESSEDIENMFITIEKEKVNILCIDENPIVRPGQTNIYESYIHKLNNIRVFRLVLFNTGRELFLHNKNMSNNYIFTDWKLGNVLAFNKSSLNAETGYLGLKMIGQELQNSTGRYNKFEELEINISESLIFHSYFEKNKNVNIDISITNYSLGLKGYIDAKGDIYVEN